ncbi:hypothetical protein Cgig2_011823 [Carnegiea gigantea]|uniref:RNase H type-1 domain-containing protein n=1 Tax=Carnegiea gigantea TaxID=171969 RepID=A0A9Q1Q8A9_9CARY|nr:hypothetical protein Cgig2_011823 [Carnegiea gigantea]
MKVHDLIDVENGCWREALVKEGFLDCDYEVILKLPLSTSWPPNRLVWHFSSKGLFRGVHRSKPGPDQTGPGMEGALLLAIMTFGKPFGRWMFPHECGCLGGGHVEASYRLDVLGDRAVAFVRSFREAKERHDGDVLLAGNKQGRGFIDAKTKEARACLFGFQQAKETGHTELIINCNCMNLVQKLKATIVHENFVGWVIQDILRLVELFNYYAWSFVK